MYVSTHVVAGAAIGGTLTASGAGGLALGLLSHAVLDILPHHDYKKVSHGFIDFLLTILLSLWIMNLPGAYVWGAVGGAIPDLEILARHTILPRKAKWFPTHSGMLPHGHMPWPWGFFIQLGIILIGGVILVTFS